MVASDKLLKARLSLVVVEKEEHDDGAVTGYESTVVETYLLM